MNTVSPTLILYPVFALFLLTALVLLRLRSLRFAAVRNQEVQATYYRAFQGSEPEALQVVARNFINLFEVPVLFYVGVIMIYITQSVSYWLVACAWTYVALRYAHTYVHLTTNNVVVRFSLYFGSGLVLTVMWLSLFVRLVLAG
jgi:hypothetical protein